MKTTIKALAEQLGVNLITPRRWVKRGLEQKDFRDKFGLPIDFKASGDAILPKGLYLYLLKTKSYPEAPYELEEGILNSIKRNLREQSVGFEGRSTKYGSIDAHVKGPGQHINVGQYPPNEATHHLWMTSPDDKALGTVITDEHSYFTHKAKYDKSDSDADKLVDRWFARQQAMQQVQQTSELTETLSDGVIDLVDRVQSTGDETADENSELDLIERKGLKDAPFDEKFRAYIDEFKLELDKQSQASMSLTDRMIRGELLPVISFIVFFVADGWSCGWIAYNRFDQSLTAAIMFSFIGLAVAYSSIKNAIDYKGKEGDGWLAGFGVFQSLLHACALGLFGSWSSTIGAIVICIAIPAGTIGLAITYKRTKS